MFEMTVSCVFLLHRVNVALLFHYFTCMMPVQWRLGLVVVRWSQSTKLLYAGPG